MKHNNSKREIGDALETSEVFFVKYKKALIGVLVAIIVLVCGYFIYQNYIYKPKELKAQEAISLGEEYFKNGQYELVIHGDSVLFDGMIQVANEYSGTKSANLANYYTGISYQKLGQYEEAINYLKKFNNKEEMVYPACLVALGNCYANIDKTDDAIATLKKAASIAKNTTISPIALRQAGILLEKEGKFKEALVLYKEIKDTYFKSPIAVDIDKYIERANAQIKK